MVAVLTWTSIAVAAGPNIANVTFGGTNADLTATISGRGFGSAPPGVPCKSCTTQFLNISGRIGCEDAYNIASWTDNRIILSGLQGNPGGNVLISVENPQNKTISVTGIAIPNSITMIPRPKIESVAFTGSGRSLKMTIRGFGFGAAPHKVPGEEDLPFFSFVDLPFDATAEWVAGYASCGTSAAVTLDYASWSPTRIAISGFGPEYGRGPRQHHNWTVSSGDIISIAVANSATNGLKMNYSFAVFSPLGTGTLWGGRLP
jgi:hypothetical protein